MVKSIFLDLRKFKHYSLLTKSPVKIKGSAFFVLNIDIQKLSFWNDSQKGAFAKKI